MCTNITMTREQVTTIYNALIRARSELQNYADKDEVFGRFTYHTLEGLDYSIKQLRERMNKQLRERMSLTRP